MNPVHSFLSVQVAYSVGEYVYVGVWWLLWLWCQIQYNLRSQSYWFISIPSSKPIVKIPSTNPKYYEKV